MPTPQGAETIGERLRRLRDDLTRVRAALARQTENGASFGVPGVQATEIAFERLSARERALALEIAGLEGRLAGSVASPAVVQLQTRL